MHEPDDELDWETECARTYRETIKARGDDGISRLAAINSACERIQTLIDDGSLLVPSQSIRDAIKAELTRADKRDLKLAAQVLEILAKGQATLDFGDDDPLLDMTVGLGDGLRKVYRYVTVFDLDRMNEERRKNVIRAQRSFADNWQPIYEAWRPVLQRHATLGEAVDAGDLPSDLADSA